MHITHILYIFAKRYLYYITKLEKNVLMANISEKKTKKKTLLEYFQSLPLRETPRKTMIETISKRCGVTTQTARNWCIYGIKPRDYKHVRILSEITGIKEDDLWK